MNLFATGRKFPNEHSPYTTDAILLNGKEILSNIEERLKNPPPVMNREMRRRAARGQVWCSDCHINWNKRFDEWSQCTVWPNAKGHNFV